MSLGEAVSEGRRGGHALGRRKIFPGHVLVRCALTDDVYALMKNTPNVTGFLGGDGEPLPISDAEAGRMLNNAYEGSERPRAASS